MGPGAGAGIGIQRVGHVVLKMRDLNAAKHFYGEILGMNISREREGSAVFFRFETYHHDIAIFKVDADADLPKRNQVGLAHVALIAENLDAVKALHERLIEYGVPITRMIDHGITKSIYFKDPEGNELEVYCEVPEYTWNDPADTTTIMSEPLTL